MNHSNPRFIDRTNEVGYNKYGSRMTIVDYKGSLDIAVEFDNKFRTHTSYSHFKDGVVLNPYDRSVEGIGFIGEGKYYARNGNGKLLLPYAAWGNMLKRCYNQKSLIDIPSYKECTVHPDWHNLQNFGKWYDENFYHIGNEVMEMDKDILVKGNKIYGPDTCCFVPRHINILFVRRETKRGASPIGTSWNKRSKAYEAYYNYKGKRFKIGLFDDKEEAFEAYKVAKEKVIKSVAAEYKNKIPMKLYNALMNYAVEIGD